MRPFRARAFAPGCLVLMLAACGGNGSSPQPDPDPDLGSGGRRSGHPRTLQPVRPHLGDRDFVGRFRHQRSESARLQAQRSDRWRPGAACPRDAGRHGQPCGEGPGGAQSQRRRCRRHFQGRSGARPGRRTRIRPRPEAGRCRPLSGLCRWQAGGRVRRHRHPAPSASRQARRAPTTAPCRPTPGPRSTTCASARPAREAAAAPSPRRCRHAARSCSHDPSKRPACPRR